MKKLSLAFSVLIAFSLLTACSNTHSNSEPSSSNIEESSDVWGSSASESSTTQSSNEVSAEFKQALNEAQTEATTEYFSENKIKRNLSDNYSSSAVDYALANVNVDWKQNAVHYAQDFINNSGEDASEQDWDKMERALTSEFGGGFTRTQASYALDTLHVPYD